MEGVDASTSLPEVCISLILPLTSARDVCRSSAVSSAFRSAAESDLVWEKLLPPDYMAILGRTVTPIHFSSKKELYFRLCNPTLIDDAKLSFSIDRMSGKKCYMLSARALSIVWGNTPRYWEWISLPESRFPEVAKLLDVCWLEIQAKVDTQMLSHKTTYKAYFVMRIVENAVGLAFLPVELSVKLGGQQSNHIAFLQVENLQGSQWLGRLDHRRVRCQEQAETSRTEERVPQTRNDGWKEIEMGEFFNDDGQEGDVEMSLMEVRRLNWKRGFIVEGLEIRPISS